MELVYVLLIIFLDQLTKYITRVDLSSHDITLIPNYLSLTYVQNRGAAFGIFYNMRYLLIGITAVVVGLMIYYLLKNKNINKSLKISLILIIAGASSNNLLDRIYAGYVTDFIHFHIKQIFDWPVFNVADISVVCGTILLAWNLLFSKE